MKHQLDPHLNSESIQALARRRAREQHNIFRFYLQSLQARDAWRSRHLALARTTGAYAIARARSADAAARGIGLLLSWAAAHGSGAERGVAASLGLRCADAPFSAGRFFAFPAAVLALLSVLWNVPGALAIALIVFPRDYRYARNLLAKAYSLPHIITARAKGLERIANSVLACRPGGRPAVAGGRGGLGEHRGGSRDPG